MGDLLLIDGKQKQPSTKELLDAHAHLLNHLYGDVNKLCLKCALELRIPDTLHKHGKPMTLSELNKTLNINEAKYPSMGRLMRVLVHAKYFTKVKISEDVKEEDEEEEDNVGFTLTQAYRPFLITDGDLSLALYMEIVLGAPSNDAMSTLSAWFKNEDPTPFWTVQKKTWWDHFEQNPEMNLLFNEAMAGDTRLISTIVPRDCREVFQGLELMVDVGGGTGFMARNIVNEFPNLKATILDLPQVVEGLKGDDKVTFVGGNMLEFIPPCDAVLLKWILHNWSDEDCLKILGRCREAIEGSRKGKGGNNKVIIIEMVVGDREDDHKAMETQLFFDMLMMALFSGKERTEKDWAKLFSEAGFKSYKITPLLGLRSLIEVFP